MRAGTMQDELPAVFCDNLNVDPAFAVEQFGSANVVHISIAVGLVLLAVVVEADLRLVIAHVDECVVHAVANTNLGARQRKPVVNENQPYPRFLWGFSSAIHQRNCDSRSWQSPCPRVALAQQLNVGRFDASRASERIEVPDREITWQVSSDVEGSAFRRGDRNPVDHHDVLGVYSLVANCDAVGRTTAPPDHLDGRCRVDPQRALECGRGSTGDHAVAA
jgi:hypothetical protein